MAEVESVRIRSPMEAGMRWCRKQADSTRSHGRRFHTDGRGKYYFSFNDQAYGFGTTEPCSP